MEEVKEEDRQMWRKGGGGVGWQRKTEEKKQRSNLSLSDLKKYTVRLMSSETSGARKIHRNVLK